MKITEQQIRAINILISERASGRQLSDIAEELGISERTLRRWRMMPAFRQAFEKGIDRWRRDLWSVPLSERKARLMELSRLYASTPDTFIARVIESKSPICDETGKTITDEGGNPALTIAVFKSNAAVKSRLLSEIAAEMGDRRPKDEPDESAEDFARKVRKLIQQGNQRTGGDPDEETEEAEEGAADDL